MNFHIPTHESIKKMKVKTTLYLHLRFNAANQVGLPRIINLTTPRSWLSARRPGDLWQ